MKKFLSMVLALVMAMSLVTISAGAADFTDEDSIDYLEAVEVLTAVGVVDGYTDGSFGPDGYLTRGAAAKIICNLILGPTTAEALVADAAPYSDVPTSNVFAGYIAYCQKEGIISGYADGTFRPGNSLTGYAFMKMLLGALGYEAEQEGYTGNNWSINVAKQAINLGLEDGLEGDFNGVNTVTRQEALLYAFNAMKTTMVEYPNNSTIKVGDITVETSSTAKAVAAIGAGYDGVTDGELQFCEKYFSKLTATGAEDDYGRPATTWKYKTNTIGTYGKKADLTYVGAPKIYTVRQDLGLTSTELPEFAVTFYTRNYLGTWYNADQTGAYQMYKTNSASTHTLDEMIMSTAYWPVYGKGQQVEIFYDDEKSATGDYSANEIIIIDEIYGKVNAVKTDDNGRYVTVNTANSASWKFYSETLKKGDHVIYTVGNNAENGIVTMELAESVSGTVNFINGSTYMVIDGTGYYCQGALWVTAYGVTAGDEVIAYLNSNGNIVKIVITDANSDPSKLAVVTTKAANADLLGNYDAIVVYGDGTEEVVTLDDAANTALDTVYSYTMSNGKLKVSNPSGFTQLTGTAGGNYTKGTTNFGGIVVDANTNFVYIDDANDTIKTYVGYKNAPSIINGGIIKVVGLQKNTANAATLVYVWADTTNLTSTSSDYTVVIPDTYYLWTTTDEDGAVLTYYALRTLANTYLYVDGNSGIYANDIYGIRNTGAGVIYDTITYDTVTGYALAASNGAVDAVYGVSGTNTVKYENGVLYIAGAAYALADEVTVYIVANNGDSFVEADVTDLDGDYLNYTFVRNDDLEVETVILRELPMA